MRNHSQTIFSSHFCTFSSVTDWFQQTKPEPHWGHILSKKKRWGNGSVIDPAFPDVTKRLQSCMLRERMALLELALWKAVIFTEYCDPSDVISFLEFQRQGWKDCKRQYRSHKSVDLIVRLVLPFVSECPKKSTHNEAQD